MKPQRGRPRKPVAEQLTERIEVRASPEEKRQLETAAQIAGLKLSDWIRLALAKASARAIKSSGSSGN